MKSSGDGLGSLAAGGGAGAFSMGTDVPPADNEEAQISHDSQHIVGVDVYIALLPRVQRRVNAHARHAHSKNSVACSLVQMLIFAMSMSTSSAMHSDWICKWHTVHIAMCQGRCPAPHGSSQGGAAPLEALPA